MEKYKHAESDGWYIYIDQNGLKYPAFTKENRPGMWADMQAWKAIPENEIEPRETAEEIAIREAKEKSDAITSQRSLCKRYLDNSDKVFCSDWSYPADVPTWETSRAEWKRIFRSNEIETVNPPPFGN